MSILQTSPLFFTRWKWTLPSSGTFQFKPGMFAYLGEEKALMEEVAVLIRRFQTRMKQERREFQIQGVLIQGECLKAPRSDAGVLAKMLGIPCMALGKMGYGNGRH